MIRRVDSGADRAAAIVDAALALAEEGGFEHVRQRDVARRAGVALRTLYKTFPTKEELLATGLVRAADEVDRRLLKRPVRERTAGGRLTRLFDEMSAVLCERPKLARAIVRAATSGVPGAAEPLREHAKRGVALVVATRRGPSAKGAPTVDEIDIALILLRVWFASLIAWCADVGRDASFLTESMAPAIRHLAG